MACSVNRVKLRLSEGSTYASFTGNACTASSESFSMGSVEYSLLASDLLIYVYTVCKLFATVWDSLKAFAVLVHKNCFLKIMLSKPIRSWSHIYRAVISLVVAVFAFCAICPWATYCWGLSGTWGVWITLLVTCINLDHHVITMPTIFGKSWSVMRVHLFYVSCWAYNEVIGLFARSIG